jgi:hypothetical protein
MLSEQDRVEFAERGIVWLRGAFSPDEAARMRRRVWARLARLGATEADPATWAAADVAGLSRAAPPPGTRSRPQPPTWPTSSRPR